MIATDQEKVHDNPSPINIQIGNTKSPVGKRKNNKKLLDIIKGYEEEKMRAKFTKAEHEFLEVIDAVISENQQAQTVEKKQVKNAASKLAEGLATKLIPNAIGFIAAADDDDKDKSENLPEVQVDGVDETVDKGDEAELEKEPLSKVQDGRLSIFSDRSSISPPERRNTNSPKSKRSIRHNTSTLPQLQMIDHKRFTRFKEKEMRTIQLNMNVQMKKNSYFNMLGSWAKQTMSQAKDKLELELNRLGDFDTILDGPIEMHRRVSDKEACFVSHPEQGDIYELKHGFKFDNIFYHGNRMIKEADEWDTSVKGLKARDPRLTRSFPNLL